MKKNLYITLIIIAIVVSLVVVIIIKNPWPLSNKTLANNSNNQQVWDKPYSKDLYNRVISYIKLKYRSDYIRRISHISGNETNARSYLPKEMFIELPEMPKDFYNVLKDIKSGRLKNLCEIGQEYYLQPEFFPSFKNSLKLLQNYKSSNRWAPYGYGYYPSRTIITITPGDCISQCYFFTSSPLVETWQPIGLEVEFPNRVNIDNNIKNIIKREVPEILMNLTNITEIEQNSKVLSKTINISISPSKFLLAPNFPIYNKNSTTRVKVNICISQHIDPGIYVLYINKVDVDESFIIENKNKLNGTITDNLFSLSNPHIIIYLIVSHSTFYPR